MCLCYVIINWAQLGFLHLQQNITHYLSKPVYSQFVLKILTIVKVQDGKPVGIKKVSKIKSVLRQFWLINEFYI